MNHEPIQNNASRQAGRYATFDLDGRTALVTGAASGIGEAISIKLAASGARVLVVDRDGSGAEAVSKSIRGNGGEAVAVKLDVTNEAAITKLAGRWNSDGMIPSILVNNAGIGGVGTILTTEEELFDRMFQVNVRGIFLLTKAFLPAMIAGGGGSIINIASIGGVVAIRDRFSYCATKFAVVGMTKAMALDHAAQGIRVNCICPGRVETPFVAARISECPDPDKARAEMSATQLAGRMVQPAEVASAAAYLASADAAMITGSTFMIDSGWSAGK